MGQRIPKLAAVAITAMLACVLLSHSPHAALLVRYSLPLQHGIGGSGMASMTTASFISGIEPGAWAGYSPQSAFDTATCPGPTTSAPNVDAQFWIDSAFSIGTSSGAFFSQMLYVARPGLVPVNDNYVMFIYGGIRFPVSGVYSLTVGGDDQGNFFSMDLNDNGVFEKSESAGGPYFVTPKTGDLQLDSTLDPHRIPGLRLDSRLFQKFYALRNIDVQAGKSYRVCIKYFNYSGAGHCGMFWKKPDGALGIVPAAAFGLRKSLAYDSIRVTSIHRNGVAVAVSDWGFLQVNQSGCDTLTFSLSASNPNNFSHEYTWDFGDGTAPQTTRKNSISHVFAPSGSFIALPVLTTRLITPCGDLYCTKLDGTQIFVVPGPSPCGLSTATTRPVVQGAKTPARRSVALYDLQGKRVGRAAHGATGLGGTGCLIGADGKGQLRRFLAPRK